MPAVVEAGAHFPYYGSDDGNSASSLPGEGEEDADGHDKEYPEQLFQHLGDCRDFGRVFAIKVAVDAGGNAAEWEEQTEQFQVGGAGGLQQQPGGDEGGALAHDCQQEKGQGKREEDSPLEDGSISSLSLFAFFRIGSYQLGDGSLDSCAIDGEADAVYRENQLVDSQKVFSQAVCQKNAVAKSDQSGEKACDG